MNNAPFVGVSGDILRACFPDPLPCEPYITNAVCCLPVNKDMNNLSVATQACNSRLIEEIKAYPRKIILALGNAATWSLTGDYNSKITQIRGQRYKSELAEHGIVACVHPAVFTHGGASTPLFKRDIKLAWDMLNGQSSMEYVDADCILMENKSDIDDLINLCSKAEFLAGDIETHGLNPYQYGRILSIGVCVDPKEAYIVPPELFRYLGPLFQRQRVSGRWIWHNGKFDVKWLRYECKRSTADNVFQLNRHTIHDGGSREGFGEAHIDEDTMLLSYTIEETKGIHGLEQVAASRLGAPDWKAVISSWLPKKNAPYSYVPPMVLYRYQAKDLSSTLQIFHPLREQVRKDPKLEKLYTRTLIPANDPVMEIENNGLCTYQPKIDRNRTRWTKLVSLAEARVNKTAREVLGYDVNPGSWQQVQKLLYVGGLNLADGKILATDEPTLTSTLIKPHPVVDKGILKYRGYKKTLSTYIDGIEEHICEDGKVHPSLLLHGSTTGRLACRDPNLFNIQRIHALRDQYMASAGYILMELDLNQAELRVLAELSGDPELCRIYNTAGESIHKIVSRKFFGNNYNHEQYMRAKAVTFGIIYGRMAFSLAQELKISVAEAQRYIDAWFEQFPVAKAFIMRCRNAPFQGKILQTPFGRKRRFGFVSPERMREVGNEAANFPEQSTASDITLQSAIESLPTLKAWGVRLVNFVYDALYLEVPANDVEIRRTFNYVKAVMESVPPKWGINKVPFLAEGKVGIHWGAMKEYNPEQFNLKKNKGKLTFPRYTPTYNMTFKEAA